MANTSAPFGFRQWSGTGSAPTYEQTVAFIAYNNSTPIFNGDPVVQLNTGYIAQASSNSTQIAGIFIGCQYLSVSQKRTVWSNYWPGSDVASGNTVTAYVINDPNAQFIVQSGNGGPVTFASIGNNIGFGVGGTNGNTSNGLSTYYADYSTIATTSTLPFRIVNLAGYSPVGVSPWAGQNGYDTTTAYNSLIVAFNNVATKSLTGI
jgi:hypothetical protein